MNSSPSLLEFPCDFPMKVIGIHTDTFVMDVIHITRKYFPHTKDESFQKKASQQNHYLALTITLFVSDQVTLDALYRELTLHPDIKMVL
jgi:putative lipoic acid-binding regulatory protein